MKHQNFLKTKQGRTRLNTSNLQTIHDMRDFLSPKELQFMHIDGSQQSEKLLLGFFDTNRNTASKGITKPTNEAVLGGQTLYIL